MKVIETDLPGVLILEPKVFQDDRGFFLETWNAQTFQEATGVSSPFVQDNHSRSRHGVLRGIHYQVVRPQGKLVGVVAGEVIDVAVDLRRSSPDFGRWVSAILNGDNKRRLWIPPGFGHGFLVRSETADFIYKCTDYWFQEHERSLVWNDPELAIDWQTDAFPVLAKKDANAPILSEAEVFS